MKLKIILTTIFAALLLCLTMNAPPIFAQESNALPQPTPPLPNIVAKPTPTPKADAINKLPAVSVPADLQNNKFVQLLLISLEYQTERANNKEAQLTDARGQIAELQTDRNLWKNLYLEERKATNLLTTSLAESRNESANLRVANAGFQRQRDLDKQFIADQQSEIKQLRRSRWKYAAVGFLGGFAAGVPTGSLIAVKFNF